MEPYILRYVFFNKCTLYNTRKSGGYIVAPNHKKEQAPVYYLKNDLDLEDLAGIRQLLFT